MTIKRGYEEFSSEPSQRRLGRDTPYKGLVPYDEEDAEYFFGRDALSQIIIANLIASRLTLLYGPSGVGKSSILRAGVAHQLRKQIKSNVAERDTPDFRFVVFNSWRDNPFDALTQQLNRLFSSLKIARVPAQPDKSEDSLVDFLDERVKRMSGDLYIILDQFEEYFLYHPRDDSKNSFAAHFVRAVNSPDLRVNFLISIREDSYAKLDRFKGRIPKLFDNYLRIDHLSLESAEEAIEKPIEEWNKRIAYKSPIEIEPELVTAVLDQVKAGRLSLGAAGVGAVENQASRELIETPYLQLVMTRLWEEEMAANSRKLRKETLERLGNAETIVRTHLDKTMESLTPEEQDVAARAFRYLVTPSETKIAYYSKDLAGYAALPEKELAPVLEKLASGNLLILRKVSVGTDPLAPPRFEIFHDVLAKAILDWRSRFNVNRKFLKDATDEGRKRTQLVQVGFMIGVVALIALVWLIVFAYLKAGEARTNKDRATALALATHAANVLESDPELSALLAREAVKANRNAQTERILRRSLLSMSSLNAFVGHADQVNSAAFSDDGRLILSASGDRTACIWNAQTAELLRQLKGHEGAVKSAAFSTDRKYVVTASNDFTARIWNAQTGEYFLALRHAGQVNSAAFTRDGKFVVTASDDRTASVWEVPGGRKISELPHNDVVYQATFSPDGNLVATAGRDNSARIWDWRNNRSVSLEHKNILYTARFSEDGRFVVTASGDANAVIWDAKTGARKVSLSGHTDSVYVASFSLDGKSVITASKDRTARIWDANTGRQVAELNHDYSEVYDAEFNPAGTLAATAAKDGRVRIWNVNSGANLATLPGHQKFVMTARFSRDGKSVLTASGDATVRLWRIGKEDVVEGPSFYGQPGYRSNAEVEIQTQALDGDSRQKLVASIGSAWNNLTGIAFNSSRSLAAVSSGTSSIGIWDVRTQQRIAELNSGHRVTSGAFSPDSSLIVTAGDFDARIWNVAAGQLFHELPGHGRVSIASFSPNGTMVLTLTLDHPVQVWNAATGKLQQTLDHHVNAAAFSPDSKLVATARDDEIVSIWDLSTGKVLVQLSGQISSVRSLVFNSDGSLLVTVGEDSSVSVWKWNDEVERTAPVVVESGRGVDNAGFSSDGRYLLVEGFGGGFRIYPWDLFAPVTDLIHSVSARTGRQLTAEELQKYKPD